MGRVESFSPDSRVKTFIFHDRTPAMNHFEIEASTPAEAVRLLVERHGPGPFSIVNIITK